MSETRGQAISLQFSPALMANGQALQTDSSLLL